MKILRMLSLLLIAAGSTLLFWPSTTPEIVWAPSAAPVDVETFGWDPESVGLSADWASQQPAFQLTDVDGRAIVQDNVRANVRLWEANLRVCNDQPWHEYQLDGDCTAWGAVGAIEDTATEQIEAGQFARCRRLDPTYLYGAGRVWVLNGRIRGDGCTGAAIAKAAKDFGVLPKDQAPPYSLQRSKEWGRNGPPAQYREIAEKNRVRTVALAKSAADVRNAVVNRFGVTIASDWGNPQKKYVRQDGRWVARRTGRWMHQMRVDGYDGSSPSGKRYFHIDNSWPASQHPTPIDGSPPGGFWIEEAEIEYIVAQGDTWIFSDFDGFPARELDWSVFTAQHETPLNVVGQTQQPADLTPEGEDTMPFNTLLGCTLLLVGLALVTRIRCCTVLLAACMAGGLACTAVAQDVNFAAFDLSPPVLMQQAEPDFRVWGFADVSAETQTALPLVEAYCPTDLACPNCAKLQNTIKSGDHEVRVRYVKLPHDEMPGDVKSVGIYPVLRIPGSPTLRYGYTDMTGLKKMVREAGSLNTALLQ